MRTISSKLQAFGASVGAAPDEILFMADAIVKSFHDINGQCTSLDIQIRQLTAQRIALQPQLDAAKSLAMKVEEAFPAPAPAPLPTPEDEV